MTDPRTTAELSHLRHLANENGSTLAFLKQIIKDNKLHEVNCVAFSLPKDHGGPFGFASSMLDGQCHCWLDKDNQAEENHAFTWYHIKDEKLASMGFINRHYAVKGLLDQFPELSHVKSDPNYWAKTYSIVEVTINHQESAE